MPKLTIVRNPPRMPYTATRVVAELSKDVLRFDLRFEDLTPTSQRRGRGRFETPVRAFEFSHVPRPRLDLMESGAVLLRWNAGEWEHFTKAFHAVGSFFIPAAIYYEHRENNLNYVHRFTDGTEGLFRGLMIRNEASAVLFRRDGQPLFRFFPHEK